MDLEPSVKETSLLWKRRGRVGVGDGAGASVGLDNGGNSAEMFNLPKTHE